MQILPATPLARVSTLRSCSYFADLSEAALKELSQATSLRGYDTGEVIFWQGETSIGLYILHSGRVKLFKLSPKGRELIMKVFEPGATFNEVPVFDGGTNPINVAAIEPSELWVVEVGAIRSALDAHPEMAQRVILNLTQNLRMLVGLVEELSFCQVTTRLARLISQLPSQNPADQRLTQDQLAARLGTVREVVARSLRELERSGAIRVRRRQIEILNESALQAWIND